MSRHGQFIAWPLASALLALSLTGCGGGTQTISISREMIQTGLQEFFPLSSDDMASVDNASEDMASDKNAAVASAAVAALVQLDVDSTVIVNLVPKLLADGRPAVVTEAMVALAEQGDAAIPTLTAALKDENSQYFAVLVVGDLGSAAKQSLTNGE